MITSKREEIKFLSNLPFNVFFEKFHCTRRHHHPEISISLVLKGSVTFFVNDVEHKLEAGNLILINSNDTHEVYAEDAESNGIVLQLDPKRLYLKDDVYFDSLDERVDDDNKKAIKGLMAKIFVNSLHNKNYFSIKNVHEILNILFFYFRSERQENRKYNKQESRIESIANYIEENYSQRITLHDLANRENLSVSYLSNFFEKWFGKTFLQYYNDTRIDHAIDDLGQSDYSIEEIALRNGFDDPRSFVAAFKKRFHTLPSVYRKTVKNWSEEKKPTLEELGATGEINDLMKELENYGSLNRENLDMVRLSPSEIIEVPRIDNKKQGEAFHNNICNMIGVVSAHDLLLGDVQLMLTRAKKEIGYEFVKFHGILSDDMEVYFEDNDGNSQYNFFLIDKVLDFIVSIGMKPFIELSYMPKLLALDPNDYSFNGRYLHSEPKDMKKWCDLIEAFLDHISNKYGDQIVEEWEYSIWNGPNSGPIVFGFTNAQLFFEFYKQTYQVIREVLPNAKIFTPSFHIEQAGTFSFFDFMEYAKNNDCMPDAISLSFCSDFFPSYNDKYTLFQRSLLSKDPDYLSHKLDIFKKDLVERGINLPIQITSWVLTSSHRNLINDTAFKSCFYVRNYLKNYDKVEQFAYWCLTDLNGEAPLGEHHFSGGIGLFTRKGIEKATYNAFLLLKKLDSEVIEKGDGYFVSKARKKIHVILYNYQHYNDYFADGKLLLSQNERYLPFDMSKKQRYKLNFINVDANKLFIKEYCVGIQRGSSYDAYLEMGGVELKYDDEFDHLKRQSSYSIKVKEKDIVDGSFSLDVELNPLDVKLIEIKLE